MLGRATLLRKIVLVQIAVVLVVMTLMGYLDYYNTAQRSSEQLHEQAGLVLQRVSGGLGMHLWNFDRDAAAAQLIAEAVSEDIIGFAVYENEESFWVAVGPGARPADENGAEEPAAVRIDAEAAVEAMREEALFEHEAAVYHGDEQLGTVVALFTDDALHAELVVQRNRIITDMLAIGIVLTITLSLALRFMLVKPVRRIVARLQDIAEGDADLTQELELDTGDELGEFASLFNKFVVTIRTLAIRIKDSVGDTVRLGRQVEEQAESAYSAGRNIASGLGEVQGSFKELSSDIDDSTSAVEQILGNIQELRNTIHNQASAVTQSTASIEELVGSIKSISDTTDKKTELVQGVRTQGEQGQKQIEETTGAVRAISADVDKMLEIVDVINGITAQTNLLAMNAAIEAAHAGESGRGFAVVAEEIRKLAESTSENSKVITETLKNLVDRIRRLEDTSNHTATVFDEIRSGVQEVQSAFTEISQAMTEMKSGTDSINEAMMSLSNISTQVQGGADEMQTGAETINGSMQKVQTVSGKVGARISDMESEGRAIIEAMKSINSLAQETQQSVQALSDETERFKTDGATEVNGVTERE